MTDWREPHRSEDLSVVCFGGSAGGLEAYQTILSRLPNDTGLAFIIVNHQAADGKSLLLDILPRFTTMPVLLVEDGGIMQANHVYLVPPGKDVAMAGDVLRLTPRSATHGWPKNITHFLSSLAVDRQKRAIAVILSGFDSDGAGALKAIKRSGGIVFAQEFDTAKQPDMPISAVDTGCVDFVLSPADIAAELQHIGKQRARQKSVDAGLRRSSRPVNGDGRDRSDRRSQ
jgi:chemotaxis response regulator CheB